MIHAGTVKGLHRRSRKIGRQVQRFGIQADGLAPKVDLFLQNFALQPLALPNGKVGVLNLQFGQGRQSAFQKAFVGFGEFANQYADRPAVGNDVVHVKQDHELIVRQFQNLHAEQGADFQIERFHGVFGGQTQGLLFALRFGQMRQIDHLGPQNHFFLNDLNRRAVFIAECGAQSFVTAH